MLVHENSRSLVLRLKDKRRVADLIPTSKEVTVRGQALTAVPHKLDETRVLNNIGIAAPSPIRSYYDWPGRYKPFHAQEATADFLTLHKKAFVLNDLGTGKSLSALWAYDYLRGEGRANKLLVVSPLSTLERTWADELFTHFMHLKSSVLYGSRERRLRMLAQDADVYIINHDGLRVIEKELRKRKDIDAVVVDEIATFRNVKTERWKTLNRVCEGKEIVWGLTGTPTPNAPTDAWGQCKLICPNNVPKYFTQFRNMLMKQQGPYSWVPRVEATDIVADMMQPSIRFRRDECVDLPPAIYETRSVQLTAPQSKAYKDMVKKLKTEVNSEEVLAVNEAVKMHKLVQIACGVVYATDAPPQVIDAKPRIELVKDIVRDAGTKVIVFVPFKGVLNNLREEMGKEFTCEVIDGSVAKGARDRIFHAFQKEKDPKVLLAQPAAMSHGLTLTAASTIVWYAPITSNEIYEQANARITRPGQKHTQFLVNIEGSEVERRIYARLKNKQKMQGVLLDILGA